MKKKLFADKTRKPLGEFYSCFITFYDSITTSNDIILYCYPSSLESINRVDLQKDLHKASLKKKPKD